MANSKTEIWAMDIDCDPALAKVVSFLQSNKCPSNKVATSE